MISRAQERARELAAQRGDAEQQPEGRPEPTGGRAEVTLEELAERVEALERGSR